jgi:hypothetical protein
MQEIIEQAFDRIKAQAFAITVSTERAHACAVSGTEALPETIDGTTKRMQALADEITGIGALRTLPVRKPTSFTVGVKGTHDMKTVDGWDGPPIGATGKPGLVKIAQTPPDAGAITEMVEVGRDLIVTTESGRQFRMFPGGEVTEIPTRKGTLVEWADSRWAGTLREFITTGRITQSALRDLNFKPGDLKEPEWRYDINRDDWVFNGPTNHMRRERDNVLEIATEQAERLNTLQVERDALLAGCAGAGATNNRLLAERDEARADALKAWAELNALRAENMALKDALGRPWAPVAQEPTPLRLVTRSDDPRRIGC